MKVAVVGAGWAGLSAAFRLAQKGCEVSLYDSAPQAGGRARSVSLNLLGHERELDNGQHLLLGAYQATQAILEEALAPGNTRPQHLTQPFRLRAANASGGPLAPKTSKPLDFGRQSWADRSPVLSWMPQIGTALGLLSATGLTWSEKLAFARFMQMLKKARFLGFDGLRVQDLLQLSKQPQHLVNLVWEPLCISALNTGLQDACAQTLVHVLQDSLMADDRATHHASDYLIPTVALSRYFVDPVLAAYQELGGRFIPRTTVRAINELAPEHLVLASPPFASAQLLARSKPALASRLNAFAYQSITTVYLAWDHPVALDGPLLLREEPEQGAYGQWLFDRGYEQGSHIAAVVVSARGRYAQIDTEQLSANIAAQVRRQTGLDSCQAWRAITEKRATFLCTPDRPKLREDELLFVTEPGSGEPKTIALAGDYAYARYPATLESAVRSGLTAAERILANPRRH
jgi:hydroxysqualene dehydroxylase